MVNPLEVVEIQATSRGNLKGLATVRIGEIVVRDFRIVQQPGQRAWVGLPSVSWQTETGERAYRTIVEMPQPLKGEVEKLVLAAWEKSKN